MRAGHAREDGEWEGEEGGGEGEERERILRSVLARAKMIGSVPDELRRLLGAKRTTQGMARLVGGGGGEVPIWLSNCDQG